MCVFLRRALFASLAFVVSAAATAQQSGADSGEARVDLSRHELARLPAADQPTSDHVLSNPWWRNFDISGFGAVGYYNTGESGTQPKGTFSVKEATLFVHADVWEGVEIFVELQTNRLGKDDQLFTRTGEVYLHARDLWLGRRGPFGVKAGRIDIPFGEEYLWQDAIDNPLITNSAAYPYGWDEGVLVYGKLGKLGVVAALTDGTDARSEEDHKDKAINLKLSLDATDALYVSLSAMRNGKAGESALEFGGSHFQPVGASHQSSAGLSGSTFVEGDLVQLDTRYSLPGGGGYFAAHLGFARQKDAQPEFDRDFRWLGFELFKGFAEQWYAIARFSQIGTHDRDEGYHFDGKIFAGGNNAFGYDTRRFRRLALGLGYRPNPKTRIKLEIGEDHFQLIDSSALEDRGNRSFLGLEMAVGF